VVIFCAKGHGEKPPVSSEGVGKEGWKGNLKRPSPSTFTLMVDGDDNSLHRNERPPHSLPFAPWAITQTRNACMALKEAI
jgi:hypothetical protein